MKNALTLFLALALASQAWAYDFEAEGLYFDITGDNTAEVTYPKRSNSEYYNGYTKPTGSLNIPTKVTNSSTSVEYDVTSIGSCAFYNCSGLTSITIPNSVTSIGSSAFSGCIDLSAIVYDGTSAPTIGTDAFKNVNSSVKVCVPENYSSDKFGGFGVYKGHNKVTDQAVSPTCTETGLTEGVHCSNCGRVFVAQEETAPALGHLFTNYIYNNNATTEADGTETAECDHGCGTTDTRVSAGTRLPDNPTAVTSTDRNALSISVVRGAIVVNNAASDIVVYDTAGRIVARQKPQQQNVIAVANRGLYIVKSGNAVERVIVNDCYK